MCWWEKGCSAVTLGAGVGSTRPVASNTTAQGRTENSRVAIVMPSQ